MGGISQTLIRLFAAVILITACTQAFAQDVTPPAAPGNLAAVAVSGSQINLSWTAPYDPSGIYGYDITRCQGGSCAYLVFVTSRTYQDTGLVSAVTYTYNVRAIDFWDNVGPAAVASATTFDAVAPSAPGGLTATAVSGSQINLSWPASSDNVGVSGYLIEMCTGVGCGNFSQVAGVGATSYSVTGLATATSYSFRVRAYDAASNSGAYSPNATATTLDTSPPSAPVGLSANAASGTQIDLSWSASSDNVGVTGYAIERCQGAGCSSFAFVGTATATSYSSTGLTPATAYSFRVRARDAASNYSGYSAVASATTPDTLPPSVPSGLSATPVSSTQVNLSWTAASDNVAMTGYAIERCQGAGCTSFAQIATPTTTSYNDTGRTASTTYLYRVRARDAVPNWSGYSSTVTATTPSAGNTAGLIAAYAFDEGTGTALADASGNGNGGTLTNGPLWTSGRTAGGLQFDGSNDFVALPAIDVSGTALTLMTWVRFNSFPAGVDQRFVAKANDSAESGHWWMLGQNNAELPRLRFRLKTGGTTTTLIASSGDLATNTWYHAAAVYDGAVMKLYLNGTEVGSTTKTGTLGVDASIPVNLGRNNDSFGYLNGALDDVRVYQRALTGAEIAADMNTPVSGGLGGDTQAPSVPSGLSATAISSTQVNLSWTAASDNVAVTGYAIERCQGAGCTSFAQIATPTTTSYNDTGRTASTTYLYRVRARDAAPNWSSYSSTASATTPTAGNAAGLIAAYSFDEGTGTALADASGNGNGGTLTNGPLWTSGRTAGGLQFDGSNDFVALPAIDVSGSALTLMTWVRFSSFPAGVDQRFVAKANDSAESGHWWMLGQTNADLPRLRFRLKTGGTTTTLVASSGDLATNTWYHAAAVYDGAAMKLYLNGTEVGSTTKTGTLSVDASIPVNLGRNNDSFGYLHGALDDVRIYQRALTGAEIAADMNAPVNGGSGGDTQAPSVPSGLSATAVSSTQVNLSWTAASDNVAVTGYAVERCQGAGCTSFAQIATATTTSYNDTGRTASTTYLYRVRARDAVPNWSGYSSIVTATTQAASDPEIPTVPSAVTAIAVSTTQINLSWSASTDDVAVTGYLLERCQGATCTNFTQIATPTTTSYNNSGLAVGTTYRYRVRARDAVPNYSGYSAIVAATTQSSGDTQPPTAPTSLVVLAESNPLLMNWNASTDNVDVVGYLIERCHGDGCTVYTQIGTSTTPSYTDSISIVGESYSYRVRARDAANNLSAYSNEATPCD